MHGLMQDWPLLCHRIIDHAAANHAERRVISRSVEGPLHTTDYALSARARSRWRSDSIAMASSWKIFAVGHPKVAEAAVIGVRHPKWDERPLLIVVLKKDQSCSKNDILGFMRGKTANWWMPDDVIFVDQIPHTATGKIQKMELREKFKDYVLSTAIVIQ
jgi:hypothetical protein